MTEPTIVTLDWRGRKAEEIRLSRLRIECSTAGVNRQWHVLVSADCVHDVRDMPMFVSADKYKNKGIRPVSEHEFGFVDNARFFGPDIYMQPER